MARLISLICILSLCVSAAFAAPIGMTRPAPTDAHQAMGHSALSGAHTAHDPGNLACGICVLHCMPGEVSVPPQLVREAAFRFGAYLPPRHRVPAEAGYDAPERPPKSDLA